MRGKIAKNLCDQGIGQLGSFYRLYSDFFPFRKLVSRLDLYYDVAEYYCSQSSVLLIGQKK